MVFQKGNQPDSQHGSVVLEYSDFEKRSGSDAPWDKDRYTTLYVTQVIFKDKIKPVSTRCWFSSFRNLSKIEGMDRLDTSKVTDMSYMFYRCCKLTSIDLSDFDTSNVRSMGGMFNGCSKLSSLDLLTFKTTKDTSMTRMFGYDYGTDTYCNALQSVTVGSDFMFVDVTLLPTHQWKDKTTGQVYEASEIPSNHAATYEAV